MGFFFLPFFRPDHPLEIPVVIGTTIPVILSKSNQLGAVKIIDAHSEFI